MQTFKLDNHNNYMLTFELRHVNVLIPACLHLCYLPVSLIISTTADLCPKWRRLKVMDSISHRRAFRMLTDDSYVSWNLRTMLFSGWLQAFLNRLATHFTQALNKQKHKRR